MVVKAREEVARFIESCLEGNPEGSERESEREKGSRNHYGLQELRDLMDFIYGGSPETDAETVEKCRKETT